MKTKYHNIEDCYFSNYFGFLIGKVFKILPMHEEGKDLKKYLESLQRELIGSMELISDLKSDGYFITLLNKIEFLNVGDYDKDVCRSEVFECINIIKKIKENYNLK